MSKYSLAPHVSLERSLSFFHGEDMSFNAPRLRQDFGSSAGMVIPVRHNLNIGFNGPR
jgi:hypothetical protein